MEQRVLPDGSLRIFISDAELSRFGVTFASLDIHTPKTRALLSSLLLSAGATYRDAVNLTVEALPVEGGCLLLLSPQADWPRRRAPTPRVYALENEEALLSLGAAWGRRFAAGPSPLGAVGASSLYRLEDEYRLVLYPTGPLPRAASALLAEWGRPVGSGEAAVAFLAEHGSPLCLGDALTRLAPCP